MLEFFTGTKEERQAQKLTNNLRSRRRLTEREQTQLLEAERLVKRITVRRLGVAAAALGFLGSITFLATKDDVFGISQNDIPSWITLEDENKLGKRKAKEAVLAAIEWDNRFDCGRNITINSLDNPFTRTTPEGIVIRQEEFANPGKISIAKNVNARDNILHGMTHACQQLDEPKPLDPPIPIPDGLIVGVKGLSLRVKVRTTGEEQDFPWFEEGMAERNASAFPGYKINNPIYSGLGSLTLRKFPLEPNSKAHEFAKTSDIESFLREVLNLGTSTSLTPRHFEQAMDQYQTTYNEGAKKNY